MNKKKVLWLFLSAILIVGISTGIFRSIFNNYLKEIHSFTSVERGLIEFPREFFGFLTVFVVGFFYFIREQKLLGIGLFVLAISYLGFAFLTPNYYWLVIWVLLWSFGSHLFGNLRSVIGLSIADNKHVGHFLGKIAAMGSLGFIFGTLIVWLFVSELDFSSSFLIASVFALISSLIFITLPVNKHFELEKRSKFIFRKKYIHYYVLASLFGIRKQLFLVFAPWFIIEILGQSASVIANILFVSAILGLYVKPKLGKLIDSLGERKVLIYDGFALSIVSIGYVVVPHFLEGSYLLLTASLFFIIDELLFTLRNARETYLYKIAESKKDITPTLATGLSIEHLVSMSMPILAGIVWLNYGYQWVFAFCSLLAIFTSWYVFKFVTDESVKRQS